MDRKAGRMKSELSNVLQDADYANASEFYTELFMVREESHNRQAPDRKHCEPHGLFFVDFFLIYFYVL